MRVIFINGRKVGVLIIIVGLMLVLFGLERRFDDRLKMAALIQNNISPLVKYKGLDGKFTYKLPEAWKTKTSSFKGNDISYHNDFKAEDLSISGFVQVWNKKIDLKKFLDNSKIISEKQNVIKDYKLEEIEVNNMKGFLVRYLIYSPKEKKNYLAYEYFIDYEDVYIRFSFFVRSDKYKDNTMRIFQSIVKTLEYKYEK
jgi:hypothetical protein